MVVMSFLRDLVVRLSPRKTADKERERYGLDLKTGDKHYRAWVGPPEEYDLIGALQVTLLFAAGLEETHRLCDVGCGSLRAGRMLIPYLRPGRYYGVEPERWLVEEGLENELGRSIVEAKHPSFRFVTDFSVQGFGVEFDYVVAQSVFSHTSPDLLRLSLENIAASLGPSGKLLATWNQAGRGKGELKVGPAGRVLPNGWVYKGVHTYSWQELQRFLLESGLVGRRIKWPHPRQSWFLASRPEHEDVIEELSGTIRSPRPGWSKTRPAS